MYQPAHFIETRRDVIEQLVREHPLGLLVTNGEDGPIADPIPFMLQPDQGSHGRLLAHVARANSVWQRIEAASSLAVLVVFQGPQAYVTPNWYASKQEHGKVVPTWNYAIVQARGIATIKGNRDWLHKQVSTMTDAHEKAFNNPWAVDDAPDRFVEMQLRAIVGIQIDITEMTGKWKMSQNKADADRIGVADGYAANHRHDLEKLVRAKD